MFEKFRNMKIEQRLVSSSIFSLTIASGSSILCIIAMLVLMVMYGKVMDNYAFPQGDIGYAISAITDMRSATRGIVGYQNAEDYEFLLNDYNNNKELLNEKLDFIETTIVSEQGAKDYENICKKIDEYIELNDKVIKDAYWENDAETVSKAKEYLIDTVDPVYIEAHEALANLMDTNSSLGKSDRNALRVIGFSTQGIALVIVALVFVFSYSLNKKIAKSISDPTKELSDRLIKFRDGDLTSPFPVYDVDDEIGNILLVAQDMAEMLGVVIKDLSNLLEEMAGGNFDIDTSCESSYIGDFKPLLTSIRKMNVNIDEALKEVRDSADTVTAGATNLAEASQSIAEGATEQAIQVDDMLLTMENISNGLTDTVEDIKTSFRQAKECVEQANASKEQMNLLVNAMQQIQVSSQEISKIIEDIEDIASQTNLLSLNASIEAARAGDAGRGFAVVADRIGKLAMDSAKSASSTRKLIEGNILEVNNGNQAVESASKVLDDMINLIVCIEETSESIANKSKVQVEQMAQAEQGVQRISEVVQNNSAAAEQTSATSEELSAQALCMDEIVNNFKLKK